MSGGSLSGPGSIKTPAGAILRMSVSTAQTFVFNSSNLSALVVFPLILSNTNPASPYPGPLEKKHFKLTPP
jgi:hypothetical protein